MRTTRLVQYSLSLPEDESRADLCIQLEASVRTLRSQNAAIPVALFVYGRLNLDVAAICGTYGVMVHQQGPYEQRLAALSPAGWRALACYPLLHKFLNFRQLSSAQPKQVLCCDCDTVFGGDVESLFECYGDADVVAREEVHSRRSAYGADDTFIDEPLLARLASHERSARIPPFNLGVVLLSNRAWHALAQLESTFVDYAWRFVTWMARNPATGVAAAYGEFAGAATAAATARPVDFARALPYPSANRWILDEVALWLTLGHVRGVRTADFGADDVVQNGEFANRDVRTARWTVCHYFSQNLELVGNWMRNHGGAG
jgi:hypothetical protein